MAHIFKLKILLISLIFFVFLLQTANSQEIFKNSIEMEKFNTISEDFNNTKQYYNNIRKKMENITMNIILKISLRQLNRLYENIEKKYIFIKQELTKEKYDNQQLMNEIELLSENMKNFKKKYYSINESYNNFEDIKESLSNFIKLFFIVLFIIIVVVLTIIGIGSFFVIKSQRKYYKLQEEVSFRNIAKATEKHEKIDVNIKNHNLKNDYRFKQNYNRFKPEKSTEDLENDSNEINARDNIKRVVLKSIDNSSNDKFSEKNKNN